MVGQTSYIYTRRMWFSEVCQSELLLAPGSLKYQAHYIHLKQGLVNAHVCSTMQNYAVQPWLCKCKHTVHIMNISCYCLAPPFLVSRGYV